jgi:hypothetical protein
MRGALDERLMKIKIEPFNRGFRVSVNNLGVPVHIPTYDGACKVANAISDASGQKVVTIDYSECLKGGSNA